MASEDLATAKQLVAAIERGETGSAIAAFFHPDVVQEEFPNRISPNGSKRDPAALLLSAEGGQKLIAGQHYEVLNAVGQGGTVVLEILDSNDSRPHEDRSGGR